MNFVNDSKKQWHSSNELLGPFNKLNKTLNRLMILDHVWNKIVGNRSKFWILKAVQGDCLFVSVRAAVAKNELLMRKKQLIAELNKYFDKPWIKNIEIK